MTQSTGSPVHQYRYPSASRVSLATQETALNLPPEQVADDEMVQSDPQSQWPTLNWRRDLVSSRVRYGQLYIHEKVSPAEFISGLLKDQDSVQGNWFHDFNNLPEGAHYAPYSYDDGNWSNRLIKSTGQRAMASLLLYEGLAGQVDLIYMDPPYNINFRSNFQGMINDTNAGDRWDDIPLDVRHVKAFRDNYIDGVNSYLTQLRVQLIHGRELLRDSGSFVMQIGPDNLHYVAVLMSEVFGHENHVSTIPFVTSTNSSTRMLPEVGNWLVWFAKDKLQAKYRQLYESLSEEEKVAHMSSYVMCELADGTTRNLTTTEKEKPESVPDGSRIFQRMRLDSSGLRPGRSFTWHYDPEDFPDGPPHYPSDVQDFPCRPDSHWRASPEGLDAICRQGRMQFTGDYPSFKRYIDEVPGRVLNSVWTNVGSQQDKRYIVETPPTVLERIILMTTDPGDLILDPTCGSGAMPIQAERWGRRWIGIDSSAVSLAICRERIATAVHPYFVLQDSPEGHGREHELCQQLLPSGPGGVFEPKPKYQHDPAKGFLLERQMRVSAATLASGFTLDDVILHPDRPEVDRSKRRVSSPFTVESDLPFSSMVPDRGDSCAETGVVSYLDPTETTRNLEQALVVGGIKIPPGNGSEGFMYCVTDLEETAEIPDVTHTGRITDDRGDVHDGVFYLCREDEVAGPFQSRNLAVAARHRGARYACVVGFGQEGDIGSVARHQGNVTVLQVTAKRDLMIPGLEHKPDDDALVVISEPDLVVHPEPDGQVSVEVVGLTTYNPVTGQVEPSGDRHVVGILTDTNYDQESFRVCLINLPQSGRTSERRLRQIRDSFRVELDEAKWQRMRSNRTLPFKSPGPGGRVAVKVIDHTGMEHMLVLVVSQFEIEEQGRESAART